MIAGTHRRRTLSAHLGTGGRGVRRAPAVVAALLLAALSPGCRAAANYRRLALQAAETRDVAYGEADPRQALDVYAPREPGPHPVVVFVHGGFWHAQDRRYLTALTGLYANVGVALAARGVVAVVPSYRLYPAVQVAGEVDDVAAAVAWAAAHAGEYGGDPSRIVLAGHSAGAHLIMAVATRPELLRARGVDPAVIRGQIALSGIYDVPGAIARAQPELRATLEGVFAGEAARWSVLDALTPALAPTLFVVGEDDYASCKADFLLARAQARRSGARAAFWVLERASHAEVALDVGTARDVVGPRMARFAHAVSARR